MAVFPFGDHPLIVTLRIIPLTILAGGIGVGGWFFPFSRLGGSGWERPSHPSNAK